MNIETALKLAKPFVGSLRGSKAGGRPLLKTALVMETHVIATNSHILVRIAHHEEGVTPYLHHYKKFEGSEHLEVSRYPKTNRLFPDRDYATAKGPIDTQEMYEALVGACVAAEFNADIQFEELKQANKKKPGHLRKTADELRLQARSRVTLTDNKAEVVDYSHNFESGAYSYTFENKPPITEKTWFDPEYLKLIFKTFKQAKENTIECNFFGSLRPLYLIAGDIEVIALPVRKY